MPVDAMRPELVNEVERQKGVPTMTETSTPNSFTLAYDPPTIRAGRGSVNEVGVDLAKYDIDRVLVVCGRNVGNNNDVMEPVNRALGNRHAGTFAQTTPAKLVQTAYDGLARVREVNADAIVAVGSGSSLDIAKAISHLKARDDPIEAIVEEIETDGIVVSSPESVNLLPTIAIPTTLAGADISTVCGIKTTRAKGEPTDHPHRVSGRIADDRLMPTALYYDPDLIETTPRQVLYGSVMNGFDKGIETIYSRSTNPISNGCAMRGLGILADSLPALAKSDESNSLERVIRGIVAVQYARRTNVIHAFCHGVSYYYDVHQGIVHGILAPHVLRYVFDRVDGCRELIADALGVQGNDYDDSQATAIIGRVKRVRDALGLPDRLRSIEGIERGHLSSISATIEADDNHRRNPLGLEPSANEIESVLRNAW